MNQVIEAFSICLNHLYIVHNKFTKSFRREDSSARTINQGQRSTELMRDIGKETEFGFEDILLMTFLYLIQQFLLFTFGAQDKGTYQQGCQ